MTAYTVLRLAEQFEIEIEKQLVEIPTWAERVSGTSADLIAGDKLTVLQLMYGLLLPSGNDAAIALAYYFGTLLLEAKDKEDQLLA